jgi:hypothetical protein
MADPAGWDGFLEARADMRKVHQLIYDALDRLDLTEPAVAARIRRAAEAGGHRLLRISCDADNAVIYAAGEPLWFGPLAEILRRSDA